MSLVFDRKKTVEKKGEAAVEIYIYLGRTERKYITYGTCNPIEWRRMQRSADLMKEVSMYAQVVDEMVAHHEEMTIPNFEAHIGIAPKENKVDAKRKKMIASPNGFIEFILEESAKENLQDTTRRRIKSALDAMERYGKILRFADLTDKNVRGFDEFLRREDRTRTDICLNNYHKVVKKYSRLAYQLDYTSSSQQMRSW